MGKRRRKQDHGSSTAVAQPRPTAPNQVAETTQRPEEISDGEEDELTAYDLLVSSLRPIKRPRVGGEEVKAGEGSGGTGDVGRGDGEEMSDGGPVTESGDEVESEGEVEDVVASRKRGPDPFSSHFEQDLIEEEVTSLGKTLAQPLHYEQSAHPVLGSLSQAVCLPARNSDISAEPKTLADHHVKQRLAKLWSSTKKGGGLPGKQNKPHGLFSPLQQHMFAVMNCYKDLLFTQRTFENGEEIRACYILHALNHVLKTRSRVLKNNARLALAAKEKRQMEEPRDQGLTRPKVLILLPFREAALRTINTIISLLLPPGEGQVSHRKRFQEEFGEEEHIPQKLPKPASFQKMFAGNIDDCFRLGIAVRRNIVKLYADFYSADIIVASPLGLRTIIGAEGEKHRDCDFLSSVEVVIVDQSDVFLMQNWDHLTHTFDHLHLQPRQSHGVDFSRVRLWALNGWGRFYRQTLIFSSFPTPEINALFNRQCYRRVRVSDESHEGSICQVGVQAPQVFHLVECASFPELSQARFDHFLEKVLPELSSELMRHTAIFVPSYFDFVRLRNHMRREGTSFAQICEYTKTSDISRARSNFYHGKRHFLLYTERIHFFRRFRLRGIRHLVFYSLPLYHEFYPEMINSLEPGSDVTVTVLYSRYDSLRLTRVVGSVRARRMLAARERVHMLVTGDPAVGERRTPRQKHL